MVWGKPMIPRRKNVTLDLYITPYTKINSKWIRDSNVRPETVNLLEQTKGKASYLWSWQSLLGYGTKSTGKKTKNKQVVLCQTKKITHRREKTTEWKSNRWTGGKYSQTIYLIKKKKNCFQYIEGLLKFNRGGGEAGFKNGQRLDYVSKEDIQMDNTYMKRCSISRITRETQIQTAMS